MSEKKLKAVLKLESGKEIEVELTKELSDAVLDLVKEEKKWPQIGNTYWYVSTGGGASKDKFEGYYCERDMQLLGNMFRTKQESENMLRALRLIEAVRQDRLELNGDWLPKNDHNNWSIHYSPKDFVVLRSNELYADTFGFYQSRNDAKQVIEKHRDELAWYFTEFLPERG